MLNIHMKITVVYFNQNGLKFFQKSLRALIHLPLQLSHDLYLCHLSSPHVLHCVVAENIHTPTTEGIGNSKGEGEGGGGLGTQGEGG